MGNKATYTAEYLNDVHPSIPKEIADRIMHDTFCVGVYPGMESQHIAHVIEMIKKF